MNLSYNVPTILKFAGVLAAGLLLGWLFFGGSPASNGSGLEQHVEEEHTDAKGNIVYTCSMHPSVRQNEPGNCPICGMELIPVGNGDAATGEDYNTLTMTQAAMKLADVQTTTVASGKAVKESRLPGKVVVDERRLSSVTAHFPGRIKQLHVDFTGEQVRKGQQLASIYSPELLTAQKELLEAQKYELQNPALYKAARNKLKLWELPEEEINRIEESGSIRTEIDIVSPVSGYVLKRNISREDHVMPGTVMYQIAALDRVWVVFEAYESDLAGIQTGDEVKFTVHALPGEQFSAKITYIDPVLDPQKRTASVRAEASNPGGLLKPQMLAEGIISSTLYRGGDQVLVPKSAVLWTGERSVVYIKKQDTQNPAFELREVVLGPRTGDYYVIKSGLQPGEEVVTRGNFKIDSAAQLAGKASMMNREGGRTSTGHDHGTSEQDAGIMQGQPQPQPQPGQHQHSEHLDSLVSHYLEISAALASDNLALAKTRLEAFKNEVLENSEMTEHEEHTAMHSEHHAAMVSAVTQASESKTIESFRLAFSNISDNLAKALKNQEYDSKKLYLNYCPMAGGEEKTGANWISETEEIKNPYMGAAMLTCGQMVEEINK